MSLILACKPWQACKLVDNLQQIVPTQLSCWRIVCKLATSCEILMCMCTLEYQYKKHRHLANIINVQEQKMLLDFLSKNIIKQICFWLYSSGYRWCNVKLQKDRKLSKNIVRKLFCIEFSNWETWPKAVEQANKITAIAMLLVVATNSFYKKYDVM